MRRSVFMANCRGGGRQTKEQLHYTPLVGVDLCCHSVCHCLCGQTARPAPSLLAEYYNTANASSDPWKLPSIEMNHTDGRFVIRQDWPVHRAGIAYLEVWIWYRLKKKKKNLIWALQFKLMTQNQVQVGPEGWKNKPKMIHLLINQSVTKF